MMKKNNRRSLPAPPCNIFDQFLIVGLKQDTLAPVVLSTYPATNPAAPNVALFCFPEDITPDNVVRLRMGASFFFVLTDEVGRQQVGFTRRVGKGKDMQCLCILTHRDSSWMYTFASILEECEGRYKAGQLDPFLSALYVAPVPEPGKEIVLQAVSNGATPLAPVPLLYARPVPCPDTTDTALFGVTMLPLLANLTTTPILQLFASLLFERRTILVSAQLERVSACVQAAVSALFPFAWHHIFIPVLPLSLVDYCSAPMPFMIGLHSSLMLSLQKMPLSEVVFVDLDRDQVSAVPGDLALLPQSLVAPLRAVLDAATADFHRITSSSKSNLDWQRVAEAFRHFFVRVFAGYSKFFVQKGNQGIRFDKEGFIASQPKQIRKFLEVFCTSQMFERFIAEREVGKQNVLFENEIKLQEVAQAHAGIGNAIRDNAKKSVERLTTFGNAVRTHLENPFTYHRNQDSHSPNLPRAGQQQTTTLHPSLVRGQQTTSVEPQPRRVKPLPPIPPGATPSSAFPPNIPTSNQLVATDWDSMNTPSKSAGRPKSATVTSSSPSAVPILDTTPVLVHSTSTNTLGSPLSPISNVFEFHPFDVDITPATPAPSVSNTRPNDWFSPEMVAEKLAATNPFLANATSPSRHSLPPVSMKPLNPFEENQADNHNTLLHSDPNPVNAEPHNIFTSFSLDALAPPDIHNGIGSSGNFGNSYFAPSGSYPSPLAGGTQPNYPVQSGGTVPNMAAGGTQPNYPVAGGTQPNYASPLAGGTQPNYPVQSGGTVPNMAAAQPSYGGTVPNYGVVEQNGVPNHSDAFNSFFGADRLQGNLPVPVQSKPLPVVPGSTPPVDDFDSFLATRHGQ